MPQNDNPDGLATAHLKRAEVALPDGMAVNPSSADGLGACAPAQIGLDNADPPSCPNSSKIGTVEVDTPLLPDPLSGSVYVARQGENPFGSLLAIYIVAEGPGVVIKLPGKVAPDPGTGQLTTTFDDNPQLPFETFRVRFNGGPRAALVNPPTCGTKSVASTLSPWSAADPDNPTHEEVVEDTDTFQITSGPNGTPCPADLASRPFAPGFSAGLVNPVAGASSPFVMRLTRPDGSQELESFKLDLPPGVTAKLAGVARCPDATLAAISAAPGSGQGEIDDPSCPAASQVGTAAIGAGAGSNPYYVQTGKAYLAGPYDGAPASLAVVTPAVAGPFDLGSVVVRSKLMIDTDDAQVHVATDELPEILHGIPLRIRDIRVKVDRPGFMQAPTNCNPMQVTAEVTGSHGAVSNETQHFQVGGCGALGFSPKLTAAILNGQDGIHRSDHPNLHFSLAGTPGDANIAAVSVKLPEAFQIDQANLGNICSEANLAANQCAGKNTVGTATAITPLLDVPLTGPVYAVSGSGGLPRLAVILNGPPELPLNLLLRGDTFTTGASLNNAFNTAPDAPVTSFDLDIKGGSAGYLVNNTNLCRGTGELTKGQKRKLKRVKPKGKRKKLRRKMLRKTGISAEASFLAHNGDTLNQKVPIAAECGGKKKPKKAKRRKRSRK